MEGQTMIRKEKKRLGGELRIISGQRKEDEDLRDGTWNCWEKCSEKLKNENRRGQYRSRLECTWEGTTPCTSIGLGWTCWRAALRRGTWVS